MKKIKLLTLKLRNFKGIKDFIFEPGGSDAAVYGDNATGKTTVFDAFSWLFFGKDSQNKADFEIKRLNDNGKVETHKIEHEVEAVLDISGKRTILKRVYAEKWTKKRGHAIDEFTGHETKYFIDSVPVTKKEYDAFITGNIPEDIFKLITNATYFNEQLKWQDRRRTLLEICGDISDEEVIGSSASAGNKDMLSILNILNQGRTLDDYRKIIKSRLSEINREIEKIPIRIDEVVRGLPDVANVSQREILLTEISSLKTQRQKKQQELIRVESGGEVAEKRKALREVEGRIIDAQNKHKAEMGNKIIKKRAELQELSIRLLDIDAQILATDRRINENTGFIDDYKTKCEALRQEWHEANSKQFEHYQDADCPACGQALPVEQLISARENALKIFNINKSQKLEEISLNGKKLAGEIETLGAKNSNALLDKANLLAERGCHVSHVDALKTELVAIEKASNASAPSELVKEKELVESQIKSPSVEMSKTIHQLEIEIGLLDGDIVAREKNIALLDRHKSGQERVKELESGEKALASEFETLQKELFLTEEFMRTKVTMLEEKIGSKFKLARFKMFNEQINGGLEECCETTFRGVPYSSLNNAAKINIGLDIINALSEHYGLSAPIFIDNREAVTKLADTTAQVIGLIVSEQDKVLRVENKKIY